MEMEAPVKTPLAQRINFRLLVFAGVVLLLVGYPLYIYLDMQLTQGIKQRGDLLEVDLKAMSSYEIDQRNGVDADIPEQWRKLDGKRVLLEGEISSSYEAGGRLTGFELCYSIQKCCFTTAPKVQHFVKATVADGRTVRYYPGLVKVVGTLHVGVIKRGDKIESIYRLDAESVEPS